MKQNKGTFNSLTKKPFPFDLFLAQKSKLKGRSLMKFPEISLKTLAMPESQVFAAP
jgi:hypothetical protein